MTKIPSGIMQFFIDRYPARVARLVLDYYQKEGNLPRKIYPNRLGAWYKEVVIYPRQEYAAHCFQQARLCVPQPQTKGI